MKKFLSLLFVLGLTLSACGTAQTQSVPPAQTSTLLLVPMITQTPIPPTSTVTPLPTIPTFTPTFDVSTILTVTPAEKAECQKENPEKALPLEFEAFPSGETYVGHSTIDLIQNFLNSGGSIEGLKAELVKVNSDFVFQDITNDGISDFILTSGSVFQIINILHCDGDQYSLFPKDDVESEPLGSDNVQFIVRDLNKNGIPDIISIGSGRTGLEINILEWGGKAFTDLTEFGATMTGAEVDGFQMVDLDGNDIPEIVLEGKPNYWYYPGEPLRTQIDTYFWNGRFFSPSTTFSNPQYRFQTTQDGDRETANGNFKQAMIFYELAIKSTELGWWSREKLEHDKDVAISGTPSPDPTPDITEYPRLAAYAYYRIMLLHLAQGGEAEAASTYQILQETFGNDPYAAPYVEMASAFWEAYQSTNKMYDGCAAAIHYAVEHPEILVPLGSDYHGWQSHIYEPADVCPFR